MKNPFVIMIVLFFAAVIGMASCTARYQPSPVGAAPLQPQGVQPVAGPSATASMTAMPTQNPEQIARATMLFLQATDTAVAGEKTEMASLSLQQTNIAETETQSAIQTSRAQETSVMSTAIATITQIEGTKQATQTQGAATQAALETSTAAAATKVIEEDKLNATRFGIWSMVILLVLVATVASGIGLFFLFTKAHGSWLEQKARHIQDSKIEPDLHGRFPILPASALPGKENEKMVDMNLAHRAVTTLGTDDLTAEQALANTQSQRNLEAVRAIAESPAMARKLLTTTTKQPGDEASMPNANMDIQKLGVNYLTEGSVLTPTWNLVESWDGKGGIPYGVSARGLEQVSLQDVPHGGVFGKTGSGKSRGFLRPFIAGAIAAGQRVVIIGKQADFWPFAEHPNVKMIPVRNITDEVEADRYAEYLKRIVEEMNRRDDYLTSHHVSTWDRAGRENTLLILDELGNALDMMPTEIRKDALRWVQGLSKEGRKAGFNIWLATQRAVGFKSIVEQLGRAVFYLSDSEASRYALGFPGAEHLRAGEFIAKFHHGTNRCASFDPTDDDLVSFLRGRSVKIHEPINWIEGTVVGEHQTVAGKPQNVEDDVDAKIMRLYKEMLAQDPERASKVSIARIQREVYGRQIPTEFYHVQELIKAYQDSRNRTTTGNMPDSDPLPA